jgi:DNA-directed RNA polymerase specialized sigma24 family protein
VATTRLARPPDAQTVACPCRHGDVPAEIAGQRPLLERAAAGDREAFALLYDAQVEGVYRYLLAWTGDRGEAAELTAEVFHGALAWLPVTAGGEAEAGAWLIAMARDAVAQRRGSGWIAGPAADAGPAGVEPGGSGTPPGGTGAGPGGAGTGPREAVAALARLGDPEREVAVLRLLLGHSLGHTAHLSGYSRRAVLELQLAACLAIWDLNGRARSGSPAQPRRPVAAEEFERRLGRWEIDLTGSDPALAEALAVAGSLRQAIPGYVVAPDDAFVRRLRAELLAAPAPELQAAAGPPPDPPAPGAGTGAGPTWRSWLATAVATIGTVAILALQAFGGSGGSGPPSACGDRPCPPPTTVALAADGGLGTPPSTAGEPSTTSSTAPSSVSATTAAAASSAAVAAPTTRPATTAPPTTRRPRPTTTRAPTTSTAPTTTAATTTTSAAPAPP